MGSATKTPSFDVSGLNLHVVVRYRYSPLNQRRVFIANSCKSVDALVTEVSEEKIGLVLPTYLEPATPVQIEIGDSGAVPYLDLAAQIAHGTLMAEGQWWCACEWALGSAGF